MNEFTHYQDIEQCLCELRQDLVDPNWKIVSLYSKDEEQGKVPSWQDPYWMERCREYDTTATTRFEDAYLFAEEEPEQARFAIIKGLERAIKKSLCKSMRKLLSKVNSQPRKISLPLV